MRYLLLLILLLPVISCSDNKTTKTENEKPVPTSTEVPDTASTAPAKTIVKKPALDSALMIVPGQRIGQISLGQTAEVINNKLGKADSGDAAMGKAMAFWYSKGQHKKNYLAVYFFRNFDGGPEDLLARQIRINSPSFKTTDNISPGSNITRIRRNYSLKPIAYYINPKQQRIYIFDDVAKGMAFEVSTPDSICVAIAIHQKGEAITNSYLPVHPDLVYIEK